MYWSINKRDITKNGWHKLKLYKKNKSYYQIYKKEKNKEKKEKEKKDIAMPAFMLKSHSYIK